MSEKVDIAALRELLADYHANNTAVHTVMFNVVNALPALLDELEALREQVASYDMLDVPLHVEPKATYPVKIRIGGITVGEAFVADTDNDSGDYSKWSDEKKAKWREGCRAGMVRGVGCIADLLEKLD